MLQSPVDLLMSVRLYNLQCELKLEPFVKKYMYEDILSCKGRISNNMRSMVFLSDARGTRESDDQSRKFIVLEN
jgi:hypothetical protein